MKIEDIITDSLTVEAKKLLYSCSLSLSCRREEESIFFEALGHFRMGPKKSTVLAESQYEKRDDGLYLKKNKFVLEGLNIEEKFLREDDRIEGVVKDKSVSLSLSKDDVLIDPILLVYFLYNYSYEEQEKKLVVGGKLRSVLMKPVTNELEVFFNSEVVGKVKRDRENIVFQLNKLGIKFTIKSQ